MGIGGRASGLSARRDGALPTFRYHPDPLATGSVKASDRACRVCGRSRGYVYAGPVRHAVEDLDNAICPWCIADGSAHAGFGAEFTDPEGVGGFDYGNRWDPVPREVAEEVAYRTPGFFTWQSDRWWTHCGDAAEFLGYAGHEELTNEWRGAVDVIRREVGWDSASDDEWADLLREFDRDGSPSAYVFRCKHCGQLGGFWDCH